MPIAGNRQSIMGGGSGARGIKFQPDANTVLWLPGQDDAYSSTIRDRSGNKNNGTITGATWVRLPSGLWYLSFDGSDDVVGFGDPANLSFGDGSVDTAVSMVAWVKRATASSVEILGKYGTSVPAREWVFRMSGSYAISLWVVDASTVSAQSTRVASTASTANIWLCVGATYDGGGGATAMNGTILYQNGAVEASTASNDANYVAMENTAQAVEIGRRDATFASGDVALVRVFRGVVLTATQMAQIYQQERHLFGV